MWIDNALTDLRPKRNEGELGKFEMLYPEGNPQNSKAEQQTNHQVTHGQFPSEEKYPENIQQQSSHTEVPQFDVFAKRQQNKLCYLKTLKAKGNANDRNAQNQTCQKLRNRRQDPSEY